VKGKFSKSAVTSEPLWATECRGHPCLVALGALVALASVGHYAYGGMKTQAMAQPQESELYQHHEQYQSPLHEDESVHQKDLENRADMLGVEQDFFRGGPTNFTYPGYRDLPNAPQMQLVNPTENDRRTANGTQP
jgi:hypothetical protein